MGKYLDIARKFEARRQMAGQSVPQERAPVSLQEQGKPSVYGELVTATPPSKALEVFADWAALRVKSEVLNMTVWVVRDAVYGLALAKETGQPALLLDDVLKLKGATQEEARAALLPILISVEQ